MPAAPTVSILSTGSEILQGLYADTNAQRLSQLLLDAGFQVVAHAAAPDDPDLIRSAIAAGMTRAQLLAITGGLGPTEDDVNREVIAQLLGLALVEDPKALQMMEERFMRRGIPMPERNKVQALIPDGATTLYNYWGTAPGFLIPGTASHGAVLALPGPPSEWRPMFEAVLNNELAALFPARPIQRIYSIQVALTPESIINQALRPLFHPAPDREMTILASQGVIRLRLLVRGNDEATVERTIADYKQSVLDEIGPELPFFTGYGEAPTLPEVVLELLRNRGETLALAESCTGGGIAQALTDCAGSSDVVQAGWVTYSNEAKVRDLGVPTAILDEHGAVSGPTVEAMALGARRLAGTDWAVAVSGVAGPGGGTEEKPVGTVWFAVAGPQGQLLVRRRIFSGTRSLIRQVSVYQTLEFLRRTALGINPDLYLSGRHEQSATL